MGKDHSAAAMSHRFVSPDHSQTVAEEAGLQNETRSATIGFPPHVSPTQPLLLRGGMTSGPLLGGKQHNDVQNFLPLIGESLLLPASLMVGPHLGLGLNHPFLRQRLAV